MDLLPLPDWEVGRLRLSRSLSKKGMKRRSKRGSLRQEPRHSCTSPLLLEKNSKHSLCRVVVCFIVEPDSAASASRLNGPGPVRQWFALFFLLIRVCIS